MKKLWPCLLLLVATVGCGTVAGYQATPRWKVVVTNADGKPQAQSKVKLSWSLYIGEHLEDGAAERQTDEHGEAVFDAVTIRPNIVSAWGGRLAGAINPHGSAFSSRDAYVTAYFEELESRGMSLEDSVRTNGMAVSRLVLLPVSSVRRVGLFEALYGAAEKGDLETFRAKLFSTQIYTTNVSGAAALLHAAIRPPAAKQEVRLEMVKSVVINWKSAHYAAYESNLPIAGTLVRKYDETPFELAVSLQHLPIVDFLLASGATPDTTPVPPAPYPKNPPLHRAVATGNLELVKLLLSHRANVNQKRADGLTPLDLAEREKKPEIGEFLRTAGAKRSK